MSVKSLFRDLPDSLKKLVYLFVFLYFIYYFNFFWLIQNVYIIDHGIDYTNLSIILAIWSASIILLEVPSGVLADKIGKKPVIVIAKFAFLLGILVFTIYPSFWGFVLGVIAFGVNESFISGAQESLLYDNLKDFDKEKLFGKILAVASTAREIGLGIGVLIAGFVTQIGIKYNLWGSIISAAIGVSAALLLKEGETQTKSPEVKYLTHFKESVLSIKQNPELVKIVFLSVTSLTAYAVVSEYWVPSLSKLNATYVLIGFWSAVEAIFFSIGSLISQKISKYKKDNAYNFIALSMSVFLLLITRATLASVIAGFMVLRTVKAIAEITTMNDWQAHVKDNLRATTISINSFLKNIVYIIFGIIFGKVSDSFGLFNGFYLVAFLSFLFFLNNIFFKRTAKLTTM